MPAQGPLAGAVLSNASRHGALQRAFNDRLREWHWQRNSGTKYQVWNPPGVVFSSLQRDHHEHGRYTPPWSEWGFDKKGLGLNLVLGALTGRWALWQARQRPDEQWVVADGDDGRLFQTFVRAMNGYGLDAQEPDAGFPNLRLVHSNERLVPRFFDDGSLRSVHVHLPWPERTTRPSRLALVTPKFITECCAALQHDGELHIVADDEALLEQVCGLLTQSKLFAPCLPFPFHVAGVPAAYPAATLLQRDVMAAKATGTGMMAKSANDQARLFHSRWERRPENRPNWRFRA